MSELKEKYGILFPAGTPDTLIELMCWKKWREPEFQSSGLVDPWDCFWRGIYQLIPRNEFVRHKWAEQHVYDWTTEGFVITWGCAASGKSNDAGLLTVVDWMVDPANTVAIMASTGLGMLKIRSYESVLRYFHLIKKHAPWQMPGKLRKTDNAIILEDDDDNGNATDKASIRGVAVAEGSDQEARTKLTGAHLPYVRLILDELSQMRPAAMQVRTNLSIGAKDFKLIGLCNPDTFTDLAARHSVPDMPGGFAAIDPENTYEWRSTYGKIRRHDGLRSPAILEPDGEKKYPFLLTQSRLDQILTEHSGNTDDPEVWTMVRGFPPSQGKRQTLISMAEILQLGATKDVMWHSTASMTVLGVDPAFSAGGNQAVMQAVDVGYDKDMLLKVLFHKTRFIKIEASSQTPVLAQVGNAIKEYAEELGIPGAHIGVDDSATQSVADFMMHAFGLTVRRFVSNHKASEMLMSARDKQVARERFYNQSTELWAAVAAFIRAGQVRGFPLTTAEQLSNRPMEEGKRPLRLQSKKTSRREGSEFSAGESPDDMDAASIAIGILRLHFGLVAGAEKLPARFDSRGTYFGRSSGLLQLAQKHDLDARAYAT